MKALKPFNIAFVGLPTGKHEFTFSLDDDFFACFDGSEVSSAKIEGKLILLKKNNMMDLLFHVTGEILLECDRCLEPLWYPLEVEKTLYVKFGDHREEQSDEVVIIPTTESHFDVSQYFYEFVVLSVPLKKVHGDNKTKEQCNRDILEKLQQYMPGKEKDSDDKSTDRPADSRWDALKNMKFN